MALPWTKKNNVIYFLQFFVGKYIYLSPKSGGQNLEWELRGCVGGVGDAEAADHRQGGGYNWISCFFIFQLLFIKESFHVPPKNIGMQRVDTAATSWDRKADHLLPR